MIKKDQWIYMAPLALFLLGAGLMWSNQEEGSESKAVKNQITRIHRSVASKKDVSSKEASTKEKDLGSTKTKQSMVSLPSFDSNKNLNEQFEQLKTLEQCYQSEGTCGFPSTDPKSEFFAIGNRLKTDILKLQDQVLNEGQKKEEISEISRHFLQIADGHVKEAALHLMATQEPSQDNLNSLLKDIIGYHDAKLIKQGMLELRRYLGNQENESKIHQSLTQAMRTGSPFVAEQISKNLNSFINEESLSIYLQTMRQLSKGSHTHKNLKNAINEYQRLMQSA